MGGRETPRRRERSGKDLEDHLALLFSPQTLQRRWVTLDRLALMPHAVACVRCGAPPSASPRNLMHMIYDYGYARGDTRQHAGVRFIAAEQRLGRPSN